MSEPLPDLCSLDDVRLALELKDNETTRDALIATTITAASSAIIAYTQREFAPVSEPAETRRFKVTNPAFVSLAPYDLQEPTTDPLVVELHPEQSAPVTLSTDDYELQPIGTWLGTYTSLQIGSHVGTVLTSTRARNFGYALLDITGTWGFATVPEQVARATVVTCMSWLDKSLAAYGIQDLQEGGRAIMPNAAGVFSIPNAAKRLLEPYLRSVAA